MTRSERTMVSTRRTSAWRAEIIAMAPRFTGTLGTSGAIAVVALISGMIAARTLGPAARGDLAQLLLWPQLFATIGNLGVDVATTYHSADASKSARVHGTALAIGLAQAALLVPLYLLVVPFVYDTSGARIDAVFAAPLIPAYMVGAYSASVLMGRLRIGAFNVVRLAMPALYCGGVVALASSDALTPRTAAITFVAGHAAIDALAIALALRVAGIQWPARATARSLLSYGLRAQGGRMSAQALGVETLIVALVLSSHDLGLFVAATALLMAPQLLMSSMSIVVFPHVSATHQSGERPRVHATFAAYAAGAVAMSALLFVLAGPAVDLLFGGEFAGATSALRLLAIATVARALRQFPLEVLRGIGRPGLTSIAEAANWLLVLTAVPAGAAIGGLQGAAAGVVVVSYGSLAVLAALTIRAGLMPSLARRARIETAEAPA
ncbi:MAG: hypothetical protein WEB52_06230 [Dehalococcoidia bacterium]